MYQDHWNASGSAVDAICASGSEGECRAARVIASRDPNIDLVGEGDWGPEGFHDEGDDIDTPPDNLTIQDLGLGEFVDFAGLDQTCESEGEFEGTGELPL
jgi:hypothetical protein